ncbi:MAG: NTP transferase domain-containing protein, partial [Actinomycetota bacterium]|nr:NTP transferase domain-containing protein [Actinomycetota bacterium]
MAADLIPEPTVAVVLAGGRGSRLGGREKGEILIGGERLIDTVVEAALDAGCVRALIAGETRSASATNVNEEPRFGGPAAGLAATLPRIEEEWI